MFACLGAPEQSYNSALGFFLLYSSYARIGSINAKCMQLHLLSFVADMLSLAVRSDTWARSGTLTSLALALLILLLFVKCVALLIMVLIHGELGDSSVSITGGIGSAAYAQGGGNNFSSSSSGSSINLGTQMPGRLSRSGSFGAQQHAPQTPTQSYYMQPQQGPLATPKHPSRSGSYGNVQALAGHGGSSRSLHGGGDAAEQHSLLAGQRSGVISPSPASGSFRIAPPPTAMPVLSPPPAVAANSYQAAD